MKKLVTYALLTCFVSLTVFADVKISDLPAGTTLGGTESIPAVQSATTVKTTPSAINTYVQSQTTSATVIGKFTSCSGTKYLGADGVCHTASTGSVTSVDLTVPSGFSVTGAPITTSGTLGITGVLNPVAGGTGAATLSGVLKGNGTSAIGAAAASDVIGLWSGTCDLTTFLRGDGTCALASNGTVTSVALTAPSVFSVSGSPVTTSGTFDLTFASGQPQNEVLASPNGSSGAVSLRSLVAADLPSISSGLSGILPASNGGTGNGFFAVSGPTTSTKTFTFPDASSTVLTSNALVTAAQGGTSNGFFAVSGPTTSTKTFTFPDASSTVLTSNAAVTVAQGGTGAATLSGVLKGNGTAAIGSAASSDVIGLWSGSCSSGTFLRGDGACAATTTTTTLTGDVTGSGVGSIATTLASSLAGNHTFTGVFTLTNEVDFTANSSLTFGQHSPSDLSAGNNNNYNLGSFGAGVGRNYRLTANASGSTVTGIASSASGFWSLQFFNVGTVGDITLTNEDSASSAGNRILTPNGANVVIQPGGAVELWYDSTGVSRWRVVRTLANAVNLAASGAGGVTGTLPVSNGGIGAATLTGIAKGNGTSAFTAAASSDVIGLWSGSCSSGTFLRGDGSCASAGAGSVTSVALTVPSGFSVSGSPITSSGTLAVTGTLNPSAGGTGVGTLTAHGVLLGEGTSNVSAVAAMAADTLLQGQGVSSDPSAVSVTNCGDSTHALAYSTSTHTFSCQAITGSGSGVAGSDTQIQFNDASAFGASASLTFAKTTNVVTVGSTATPGTIKGGDNATSGSGALLTIRGGQAATSGTGGGVTIKPGDSVGANGGAALTLTGGTAGATSGTGGTVTITGGSQGVNTADSGNAILQGGNGGNSGRAVITAGGARANGSGSITGAASMFGGDSIDAPPGTITIGAGNATSTNANPGAAVLIYAGKGASTGVNGGSLTLVAGDSASATPGSIIFSVKGTTAGVGTQIGSFDGQGNLIHKQAISDQSYSYQTPTTGFTITIGNNISQLILDPAGTLATGTITMPATPIDGQQICVSDTQVQTALTVSANSGQSIKNAPTSLAAGGHFCYIYRLANTTWYVH